MATRTGRWAGYAARLGVAAAVVGATALAVMALHQRAGAGIAAGPMPPPPVAAAPLALQSGFAEIRRFVGRLEPARSAALGFERPGRVAAVLVREGDAVAAGAVLARLDTALLENERTRLQASRAALAARVELARLTDGRQAGLSELAVSAQRRDEARLQLAQAEAELAATDAALAGVAIDLEKSEIRAPFAGHVAARLTDEGVIVDAGGPVLQLLETGAPRARIGLAPEVAAGLVAGETYVLEHEGAAHPARLAALRPDLDTASRTVVALFDLAPAPDLTYGALVHFAAEDWSDQPGYWVPLTALVEGGRGLWSVYALDGDRVEREAVRVVTVDGERAYIAGGLGDGTAVVLDGTHRVIPGQAIRLAAAE